MSMADDNSQRSYRTTDPYRRPASQPDDFATASDPLAELARLIGQTDPFADTSQHNPRASYQQQQTAPADDWRRHVQPPVYDDAGAEPAAPAYPQEEHAAAPMAHAYDHSYDVADDAHHAGGSRYPHERAEPQFAARYPDEYDHHAAAGYPVGDQNAFFPQGGARYGEDDYDDPPPRSRRSGLVTAVTLIGCAMLGTAGAYGYRTYYADPGTSRAPVIVADRSPAKVVPDVANAQPPRSQDRVGAASERVVSREEQPLSLPTQPNTGGSPRVVLPSPVQSGANAAPSPQPPGSEPKRVRTVIIRPDGSAVTDPSPSVAMPPPPFPEARTPATARAAQPPAQVQRTPPPQPRVAARNQPLSLDPSSTASTAPAPSAPLPPDDPPSRAQARPLSPPAPRVAAAPADGGTSGGYVVQVSSQRSEADARASFRALQAKYPQVLNGRQPVIKRADLGSKGVYYRAMVGPFDSQSDASQFCSNLKAAGGQCLIQRN
jgi:hypothetical protein